MKYSGELAEKMRKENEEREKKQQEKMNEMQTLLDQRTKEIESFR